MTQRRAARIARRHRQEHRCDHRTRIQEPRAPGLQPHPADRRGLCRPRDPAVAVPQARRRAASTASCSNRWSAASASAATPSSACRRARCCARAAWHAPRSSTDGAGGRDARGQPARLHRRLPAALQGRAAPGPAALLRRPGRLLRLRRRALHRAASWRKAAKPGGLDTPDILLLQCEELAVIDNLSGRLYLIVYADPAPARGLFQRPSAGCASWATSCSYSVSAPAVKRGPSHAVEREFAKADYLAAVLRAKEYIAAGDMMQVQVGQRLQQALHRVAAVACTARCAR